MRRLMASLGLASLLVVGACDTPQNRSDPAPTATATATTTASARLADLNTLAAALSRHPSPPDVAAALNRLRAQAGDLTPNQWLVGLMRLTATRDRDGHTGVFPLAQPDLRLWPLQLYAFADGWRVVAAQPPYENLVGARVTGIGGMSVRQAADKAAPLVPHDNPATVQARLPQLLVIPAVLDGLGLAPELEIDGKAVRPETISADEFATWSGSFYPLVVPRLPPIPEKDLELTTDGRVVLLRYSRVTASDGATSLADIAQQITASFRAGDVDTVIVDLRRNSGGENGSYPPLLRALQEVESKRPGAVRLLIGRTTFSAATNFVAELLATTNAVAVGEAMGGAPNMWGDADAHTLTGSGLTVHVATRLWELGGRDLRPTIEPDVRIPLTFADWRARRDPALAAARSLRAP